MAIHMNMRQDMSFLFSGMNSGLNKSSYVGGMSSILGDYASIKNGSYGKLMKAYYSETGNDKVKKLAAQQNKKQVASSEESKAISKVQTTTDALKEAADALLATGKNDVFAKTDVVSKDANGAETTVKDYDKDKIYKAVSNFVDAYNKAISATGQSGTASVVNRSNAMLNNTDINAKSLAKIGITIGENKSLSIDKDTFMKADMGKVQTMFQGAGSFGYQTSAQASLINFAADSAANVKNTYTASGSYNYFNTGNLYNSFF